MIDADTFKAAMGCWGSGVTIITATAPDGQPIGFTASSFTSLSLDPPLVLFCLGRQVSNFEQFQALPTFGVNILSRGQSELSNRFARSGEDKFAGLDYCCEDEGTPRLTGSLAWLQCSVHQRLPGGDHVIVIGAVEKVVLGEGEPLLYYRGRYLDIVK